MLTLTHRIDEDLKKALDTFCETHGFKAQAVIQSALAAWLEDAEDIALIETRREGPWVSWDDAKDTL